MNQLQEFRSILATSTQVASERGCPAARLQLESDKTKPKLQVFLFLLVIMQSSSATFKLRLYPQPLNSLYKCQTQYQYQSQLNITMSPAATMQAPSTTEAQQSSSSHQFSAQVQEALSKLSSRFGADINQAFQTVPATKERANEVAALGAANPLQALIKKQLTLAENERAIMQDMQMLHRARTLGQNPVFQGFAVLGSQDYLGNYLGDSEERDSDFDSDDDDSDSDDDDSVDFQASVDGDNIQKQLLGIQDRRAAAAAAPQEDDDESESGDESDSDDDSDYDSEFDSDFDSDDDSSLGSYDDLMNEMQNQMGVILPEELRLKDNKGRVTSLMPMDQASLLQGSTM
jgi:hypothetical protein